MKKIYTLLLLFMACLQVVKAQDPLFSQFYAAPTYHNPAFAGSAFKARAIANYRNHWAALPYSFVTYAASYDQILSDQKSGVGFIATTDRAGSGGLSTTSFSAQYAYEINLSSRWIARAGLQFGVSNRTVDPSKFIFRDQLNLNGLNLPTAAFYDGMNNSKTYFDIASGLLLYSGNFWFGFGAHHLNQPNQSFTQDEAILPIHFSMMTGYKISLLSDFYTKAYNKDGKERSITPALLYKHQGSFEQLDLGAYATLSPMVIGLWYRGLPVKVNQNGGLNRDALVTMIGFKTHDFSLGYSYDINISPIGAHTGGSHELSASYVFGGHFAKKKKRFKPIPCPEI